MAWRWPRYRRKSVLWCEFVNVVRCGKVHEEILAYAKEQEIDLIYIGASGSDWLVGKLLGSNVDRVLRQAPMSGFGGGPEKVSLLEFTELGLEGIMSTLRSNIDQNQQGPPAVTQFPTDTNLHEVRCGMCAKELFVDDEGYRLYMEALNSGLDNPFRCEVCNEEYDDLAYEG